MIIPQLQGNFNQEKFFIYAACDQQYFDEFGITLINSIQKNSITPLHLHLYNPRNEQLEFCHARNVSTTHETVSIMDFDKATERWKFPPSLKDEKQKYDRILTSMRKGKDRSMQERMMKTYFACARFIRLSEVINQNNSVFLMDIDAIFRKELPKLSNHVDFYIHKNKKSDQYLAGGILLTGNENGFKFLKEYSKHLRKAIEDDYLYWSLDQDILDKIVPKYRIKELPFSMIDWDMQSDSYVWTAKGKRKELAIFIDEQKKYRS